MDNVLKIERLYRARDLRILQEEWEELDSKLSPRLPFTSPEWNILWWEHMRSNTKFVHDEFFVHIVRDSNLKLIAVAPMMLTHRPSVGPLRFRELGFFGADPYMTEVRGLICLPDNQGRVVIALHDYFLKNSQNWDVFRWGCLRKEVEVYTLPKLQELKDIPDYYFTFSDTSTWNEFKLKLSRNIKESIRKCYNSLKRDGHNFTFKCLHTDKQDDIPVALQHFYDLHAARASLDGTINHRNVFSSSNAKSFLNNYAVALAKQDRLRIFEIEIGGVIVASRIGFLLGNELYLYFTGYDPKWSKYSIMTTVLVEIIKWAIDNRIKVVNLSTGCDISKTRWNPESVVFRQAVQVASSWRSQLLFATYNKIRSVSQNPKFSKVLSYIQRNQNIEPSRYVDSVL